MNDINKRVSKNAALVVTTIASFLTAFTASSVNIAVPSIGKQFSMDALLLSWVVTSYVLAVAVSLIPFGRIADIYGRKKLFLYGISFFTLSSLLCGASTIAALLISFRVLQGIGGAMILVTAVAILASVFPSKEIGKVLGINVAAVFLGLSLGPFLGGLLTQHLGWRSIFYINVPLGIMLILLVLWKLRGEWTESSGEKFDLTGAIFYSLALIAFLYGVSILPTILGVCLILLGVFGIFVFIKWEATRKHPVLEINIFRKNTYFVFSNLALLFNHPLNYLKAGLPHYCHIPYAYP